MDRSLVVPKRIELHHITKKFGPTQALDQISFSLAPGEVLALLGDNGAGKSTLIKIISGLFPPTTGEIHWEGRPLHPATFTPALAQSLGIQTVYQHLGLIDELPLYRNFFLGREILRPLYGIIPILDHKKMCEITRIQLKEMGISRPLDPRVRICHLSGGERQALAIGRARYFGAKLLILDEPTSALSLRQTQEVLRFVRESASIHGISIIFITHTLHHVHQICDSIAILTQGKLQGPFGASEMNATECAQLLLGAGSKSESESEFEKVFSS